MGEPSKPEWKWRRIDGGAALSPGILTTDGTDGTPWGDELDQAHARMISATPDLFEACGALVNARVSIKSDNDAWGLGRLAEADSLARAAIAKATGAA